MKLAAVVSLGIGLLFACNQPTPIHAEIKNASTSCQTTSNYLGQTATTCTTVAEVVLSGEPAWQHPWIAYLDRVVDGKEDEAGTSFAVIVVRGSGKFTTTLAEKHSDKQGTPQVGFKVLGLQPLTPVN
jgi:hypothetical protein